MSFLCNIYLNCSAEYYDDLMLPRGSIYALVLRGVPQCSDAPARIPSHSAVLTVLERVPIHARALLCVSCSAVIFTKLLRRAWLHLCSTFFSRECAYMIFLFTCGLLRCFALPQSSSSIRNPLIFLILRKIATCSWRGAQLV